MKRISAQLDLDNLYNFLPCRTPQGWVDAALEHQDILLIDHAHCEKKAASTALSLMYRYQEHPDLIVKLSKLAREELRHFEQVQAFIRKRNIHYRPLTAARYANGLHQLSRKEEPGKLVDLLLLGAIIEARSCERFAAIAPYLDDELANFYTGLLASEARHFTLYLNFAKKLGTEDIQPRLDLFLEKEQSLIESRDDVFRFHSGVPN